MNEARTIPPCDWAARVRAWLELKLALAVGLNLWVYLPYQWLQHHQYFPERTMPTGWIDRGIPFWPQAVWIYLSVYLLMPLGPFLMRNQRQLLRYAAGIVFISLLADNFFLFWPTTCPRPVAADANLAYRLLVRVDNPFHAFPSLHAAFAVYSALCAGLVRREICAPARWEVGLWAWTFLILFATMATKQHVFVDIVAGGVLAGVAFVCVFKQIATNCRHQQIVPVGGDLNRSNSNQS